MAAYRRAAPVSPLTGVHPRCGSNCEAGRGTACDRQSCHGVLAFKGLEAGRLGPLRGVLDAPLDTQRLSEVREELREPTDAAARHVIRAPADGEVIDRRHRAPDGYRTCC